MEQDDDAPTAKLHAIAAEHSILEAADDLLEVEHPQDRQLLELDAPLPPLLIWRGGTPPPVLPGQVRWIMAARPQSVGLVKSPAGYPCMQVVMEVTAWEDRPIEGPQEEGAAHV